MPVENRRRGEAEAIARRAIARQVRLLGDLVRTAHRIMECDHLVPRSSLQAEMADVFGNTSRLLQLSSPQVTARWQDLLPEFLADFHRRWNEPIRVHPLAPDGSGWVSEYQGQKINLRSDQILSATYWGNGFVAEPTILAHHLLQRLTSTDIMRTLRDAKEVAEVWQRFSPDGAKLQGEDIRWHRSHPFERLITDILNEDHPIARRAPRDEDFFELTDIRVRYPELGRRRGARLQVTLIQSEQRLSEKLDRIRKPEELIFLTTHALSQHFGGSPTAAEIQSHFRFAMSNPNQHPAGPSQLLPPEFRQGIRDFVRTEAFRSTEALRLREEAKRTKKSRRDH